MTVNETLLSIIPGAHEHQRLVIVSRQMASRSLVRLYQSEPEAGVDPSQSGDEAAAPRAIAPAPTSRPATTAPFCEQMQAIRERPIVLRQESFSPAVGWFTQSELELTTQQWAAMRSTVVPASEKPARFETAGSSKRKISRSPSCDCDVVAFPFDPDRAVPA